MVRVLTRKLRTRLLPILAGCSLLVALPPWQASATPAHPEFRPDQIIVQPKGEPARRELNRRHLHQGRKVTRTFNRLGGLQVVNLAPGENPVAAAAELNRSGLVEFAEPDYLIHATALPNDPRLTSGQLWAMDNSGQDGAIADADIDATEAWAVKHSAPEIIVAVIDTGIRYTHEDIAPNMWRNPGETPNGKDDDGNGIIDDIHGIDAVTNSGDPSDDHGHGTHVAGTVGAAGNNGKGVVGVAWKVQLMALKFLESDATGSTSDAIQCIDYARTMGAHVINASWGSSDYSQALDRAIQKTAAAGIVFVAAAGNERLNNDLYPSYPAGYWSDNIVSVGASNDQDQLDSYYSNFGARTVHLVAPGTDIMSTWHSSDTAYRRLSGTSMATPHVSGAVALLRSAFPQESATQIIDRLLEGTDPLTSLVGKCTTGGRLNLNNLFANSTSSGARITQPILTTTGLLQFTIPTTDSFELQTSSDCIHWKPATPLNSQQSPAGTRVQVAPTAAYSFFRLAPAS